MPYPTPIETARSLFHDLLLRYPRLQTIYFRYRCPAPTRGDLRSARACVAAGECGCDNARRYPRARLRKQRAG
jgi:hypothetical protein